MMELTIKDRLLLDQMPVLAVPPESKLGRLNKNGQRLLIGANGIFIEIRRDWLYAVRRCGGLHGMLQTPFGTVTECTELAGQTIPRRLVDSFIEEARRVSPLEIGGIITYDIERGEWALRMNRSVSASPTSLRYELPDLRANEHRVVDLHSHGEGQAFLSSKDKLDTRGTTAVVMVAGKVSDAALEVIAYLYLNGMPDPIPWSDGGDIDAATAEKTDEYELDEAALD